MGRWAGWGAGPAGAGSTGGPSPVFLGAVLLLSTGMAITSAIEGKLPGAILGGIAALYFALRLGAGHGRNP
jgi:hypothetical protein